MSDSKRYIIDTNVLIDNPNAIENLLDDNKNTVIIPVNVLKELDNLKSDNKIGHLVRTAVNNIIKHHSNNEIKFLNFNGDLYDSPDGRILHEIVSTTSVDLQDSIFLSNDKVFSLFSKLAFDQNNKNITVEEYKNTQEYISDPKLFTGVLNSDNPNDNQVKASNFFTWDKSKGILNFNSIDGVRDTNINSSPHAPWKLKYRHWTQYMALDLLLNDDIELVSIQGSAGYGKAQPLDSKILTPNGWVKMGNLKVGDIVSTPDNKTSRIIGVYPQGEVDIFKVIFNDGTETECCKEHLWKVRTYSNNKYQVKTLNDIMGDLYVKQASGDIRLKYFISPLECSYMEEKEVPIHPYLLGVLLGDGSFRNNIKITTEDIEIIDECKKYITEDLSLEKVNTREIEYKIIKNTNRYTNSMIDILRDLNLWDKLSYDKFIPEDYLINSEQNRLELLHGLMDTDGYVASGDEKSKEVSFCSTSHKLCLGVISLVRSLGGKATIYEKNTYCYTEGYEKEGAPAWVVNINFSNHIIPFKLKRKVDRFNSLNKYPVSKGIKKIEFVGKKFAQCIEIDHPEHLYITDDFIVTHNTMATLACALYLTLEKKKYDKIIFIKSNVQIGIELGFLPGNLDEKLEPYNQYIKELLFKLHNMRNAKRVFFGDPKNKQLDDNVFQIIPLNFIRGMNIDNSFVIIDECQNLSRSEIKTILTRMGENVKCALLGDTSQIDAPKLNEHNNALSVLVRELISNPSYAHMVLTGKHSRGPICDMILNSEI